MASLWPCFLLHRVQLHLSQEGSCCSSGQSRLPGADCTGRHWKIVSLSSFVLVAWSPRSEWSLDPVLAPRASNLGGFQRDQLSSLSVFPVSASSKWRLLWLGDCPAELTATILGAEVFFWYPGSAGGGGRLPEELSLNFPPQERGGGVSPGKASTFGFGGDRWRVLEHQKIGYLEHQQWEVKVARKSP